MSQAVQADASQDVADHIEKKVALPLFEAALLRLGLAGTNGEVTALFNGRATWNQVRDWRRGRNRVPQWAWDYLGVLLDQHIAASASVRASIRKPPNVAQGRGSHGNLNRWRAKEKAAPKDGP